MNHPIFFTLAFVLWAAPLLPAQELTRWTHFQDLNWDERIAFVSASNEGPADVSFLLQALALTDAARIETGSDIDVVKKRTLAVRLVKLLAEAGAKEAVGPIAKLPVQYRDPVLRGESWVALARLGDQTSVPAMIRALQTLNEGTQRTRGEETQAAFLIQALGILKAADGFRAVAQAWLAWYSPASQVRILAKQTLPLLVPDVGAAILQILSKDDDLVLREGLFQEVAAQKDNELVGKAASAVLETLVNLRPQDRIGQDRVDRLILTVLVESQSVGPLPNTLIAPLRTLLTQGSATQKTQAIRVAAKIDDDEVVELLATALDEYNTRQKGSANRPEDLSVVRELFRALVLTGRASARSILTEAQFSGYTPALSKEAADAMEKLPLE